MSYDDLRDRLAGLPAATAADDTAADTAPTSDATATDAEPRDIVAFPDGSVDSLYALRGSDGERLDSPDALATQLREDVATFPIEPIDVRPGGQAVNAALQAHALGEDVTLAGHLDHPVLEELPFETRSMGTPTRIGVLTFDDEEVLFPEPGPAENWGLDDLLDVLDWTDVVGADALCCPNWVSVRGVEAVFERLATDSIGADERRRDDRRPVSLPVVVDPGAIQQADPSALTDFFDVLGRADSPDDGVAVVLSVNPTEFAAAAAVADGHEDARSDVAGASAATPSADRVASVRSTLEIAGVVVHGSDAAVGARRSGTDAESEPPSETATIPMLDVGEPALTTGAGDRFSGGLTCALAREWPWPTALAFGNACGAAFVGSAETASPTTLRRVVRDAERER